MVDTKPAQPIGGTEILHNRLKELVDLSSINLIVSVCNWSSLSKDKPNVLWQHLSYDQEAVFLLRDPAFVKQLHAIVFVSHWQHEQFLRRFPINNVPCYVIQNATDVFEPVDKPNGRIKLIYTSTPWRGLHVLADVLKRLDRDVDVEVYSGTSIYGPAFSHQMQGRFEAVYEDLKRMGVSHTEYAPNSVIRKAVEKAHILAYPSTFEETSCLAAIEALSAGCKVVTTNYGALYETCSVWADYTSPALNLVERYTANLQHNIDCFWDNYDERSEQQKFYTKFWSWDRRKTEWEKFLTLFSN